MPRQCSICNHVQRSEIEAAILRGETYRSITEGFGVSTGAIARHKNGCMKETIQEHEIVQATDLQKWTTRIRDDLERIGDKAEQAGIYGPAVSARRAEMELIKTMGLQAEPEKTDDDGLMKALDEATAAVWEGDEGGAVE